MAEAQIQPIHAAATDSFRARMKAHNINGVRLLSDNPVDAVYAITAHIHSLALVMEAAHEKTGNGESSAEGLNPQVIAGAFGGLAYLASLANFFNNEIAFAARN